MSSYLPNIRRVFFCFVPWTSLVFFCLHAQEIQPIPIEPVAEETEIIEPILLEPGEEPEPGSALWDLAMTHYEAEDWQNAYNRFNSYLRRYPQGSQAAWAEFRMGECARRLNFGQRASEHYKRTIQRYPKSGEPVASASFQQGVIFYLDKRYDKAAPLFQQARKLSKRPAVQVEANYLLAISSEQQEDWAVAKQAYEAILGFYQEGKEPPAHIAQAHLSLARLKKADLASSSQPSPDPQVEAKDQKIIAEILAHINAVIESDLPKNQAQNANAYNQRGLIELRKNNLDAAIRDLRLVVGNPSAIEQDVNSARFGLLDALYRQERWLELVAVYQQAELIARDPLIRARLHLMGGNAFYQSNRLQEALLAYDAGQVEAPLSPPGTEAGYRKLLILSQQQSPNLLAAARIYMDEQKNAQQSPWIDRARLLVADYHLRQKKQQNALDWYSKITDATNLFPEFQPDYYYKLGWLQTRSQQYAAAAENLSKLEEKFPQHPQIAQAQVMRAHGAWKLGNVAIAETGFKEVIKAHGQTSAAESAWRQLGEMKMELSAPEEATAAFEGFLSNFPNSKTAAEVYSRLGEAYRQVEDYRSAIVALETSADLEPRRQLYALSLMIPSYRALEDVEGAAQAVDLGLSLNEELPAARNSLLWLGSEFYGRKEFNSAVKYLSQVRDADLVMKQRRVLHLYLARALTQSGRYSEASIAYTNYLALEQRPAQRAQALVGRARSLLKQKKFALAKADIQAGQELIQEGRTQAELSLLAGELALAQKQWKKAAQAFVAPANAFVDPLITPYAYQGMIDAFEGLGEQESAQEYRQLLTDGYPNWKPRKEAKLVPAPQDSRIRYIAEATPLEPVEEQNSSTETEQEQQDSSGTESATDANANSNSEELAENGAADSAMEAEEEVIEIIELNDEEGNEGEDELEEIEIIELIEP